MTDLFDDALFRAGACTAAAKALEPAILADVKITRAMLNDAMIGAYGGTDAEGRWTQRESFEVLEHAIALVMRKRSALRPHIVVADIEAAAAVLHRLPTQTVRSEEQIEWQQFSTPLDLAAVALHLAAPTPQDIVLEPSAGSQARRAPRGRGARAGPPACRPSQGGFPPRAGSPDQPCGNSARGRRPVPHWR